MPTGIWSSRLRSGSAHFVAVEVRQCPLGSGLRGGGGGGGGGEEEEAEAEEEEENSSDKI